MTKDSDPVACFIGPFLPDNTDFIKRLPRPAHLLSFTATWKFQRGLMSMLNCCGIKISKIISVTIVAPYKFNVAPLFYNPGKIEHEPQIIAIPTINVHFLRMFIFNFSTFVHLIKWGVRNRSKKKIVFSYNLDLPNSFFVMLAARIIRAKHIIHVADIYAPDIKNIGFKTKLLRTFSFPLQCLAMRFSNAISHVHPTIQKKYLPSNKAKKAFLLEIGLDENSAKKYKEVFQFREKRKREGKVILFYAGSIGKVYNSDLLIEAMEHIDKDNFELHFAGVCTDAFYEEKLLNNKNIIYHGMLREDDVLSLYKKAGICFRLLTQEFETGFPSKIIELLACGIPTISTKMDDAFSEYSQHLNILEEESPKALAKEIELVIRDYESILLKAKNGQQFVFDKKSYSKIALKYKKYLVSEKVL